jgi:26S proteasome regulatory subunit T3
MIAEEPLPSHFSAGATTDLYAMLKSSQRQVEFLDIQEEYIKDEMRNLKRELIRAKVELSL